MRKRNSKKRRNMKCHVCGEVATHVILIELREKPGKSLKENNVLRLVCDEHSRDNNFDNWVPHDMFAKLIAIWKKEGYSLTKAFCTINIKKLQ